MADIKKIILGTVAFFIGYIIVALTSFFVPDLLDAIDMNSTLKSICWAMLIMVWTMALVVVPAGLKVLGLKDKSESKADVFGVATGVLYAIFSLALARFTWAWTSPMTAIFTENTSLIGGSDTLIIALFWVGYIIIWVANIILTPYIIITDAKSS